MYCSCFFFCSSACRCCSKRTPGVSGGSVCAWTVNPARAVELTRAAPKRRLILNPTGKVTLMASRLVQSRLFGPPGGLTGRLIAGAIFNREEDLIRDQLSVHQGQEAVL